MKPANRASVRSAIWCTLIVISVFVVRGVDFGLHVIPYVVIGGVAGDIVGRHMFGRE